MQNIPSKEISVNITFAIIIPDRKHSSIIPIIIPVCKSLGKSTFFTVLVAGLAESSLNRCHGEWHGLCLILNAGRYSYIGSPYCISYSDKDHASLAS